MRNKQVDALRGILILMIVFFHYTFRFSALYGVQTTNFWTLAEWGAIGVAGFFVISGFFLKPKETKEYKISKYLYKRIARLYPMYLLAIVVIFIAVSIFGLAGREVSFKDFLLNIPLINGFIGVDYVDGAHWYITYLVLFTIIIGVVCKLKIPMKYFLPIWLIVKDALFLLVPQMKFLAPAYRLIGGDYVEYIVVGLGLAEILRFKVTGGERRWFGVLVAVALIQKIWMVNVATFFGVAIFVGVFILALKGKLTLLEKGRLLGMLGDSSYVLYLFHQNLGFMILLGLCGALGERGVMLYVFGTIVIMIAGSYAIHKFCEMPMQRLLIKKERN